MIDIIARMLFPEDERGRPVWIAGSRGQPIAARDLGNGFFVDWSGTCTVSASGCIVVDRELRDAPIIQWREASRR